jgi:hypothetical protein
MGGGLLLWSRIDRNPTPHTFGLVYLAAGGLSLLTSAGVAIGRWLAPRTHSSRSGRGPQGTGQTPPAPESGTKSGLALLAALLLTAVLSGVVIQSLVLARLRGRAAEERQARFVLRTAAADAAWAALRTLPAGAGRTPAAQVTEAQLPSGAATRVTVQAAERTALPPPLRRPDMPLFGQYLTLTARATLGKRESLSRGLACRLPGGELRILSWLEHP